MQNVTPEHPISAEHLQQIHPDTLGADVMWQATQLWGFEDFVNAGIEGNTWRDEVYKQKVDPRYASLGQRAILTFTDRDQLLGLDDLKRNEEVVTQYPEAVMEDYLGLETSTRESVNAKVDELRSSWLKLKGLDRTSFDDELDEAMEKPQRDEFDEWKKDPDRADLSVIDWLTEAPHKTMPNNTRRERRLRAVQERKDSERIISFLAAHNRDTAEQQQDSYFEAEITREKTEWKEATAKGVEESWLHPHALTRLHEIDKMRIYEGDAFSTLVQHRAAYYDPVRANVIIGPGRIKSTSKHEFDHAALQTFSQDPDNIFTLPSVFEPITEEIALTQNGKPFDKFDPKVGYYQELRQILADSMTVAMSYGGKVSFRDFTLGYSAPKDEQIAKSEEIKRAYALIPLPEGTRNFFTFVAEDLTRNLRALEGAKRDGVELTLPHRKKIAAELTLQKVRSLWNENSPEVTS